MLTYFAGWTCEPSFIEVAARWVIGLAMLATVVGMIIKTITSKQPVKSKLFFGLLVIPLTIVFLYIVFILFHTITC